MGYLGVAVVELELGIKTVDHQRLNSQLVGRICLDWIGALAAGRMTNVDVHQPFMEFIRTTNTVIICHPISTMVNGMVNSHELGNNHFVISISINQPALFQLVEAESAWPVRRLETWMGNDQQKHGRTTW